MVVVALAAGRPNPDTYRATYIDGLRNLLDALDEVDARDEVDALDKAPETPRRFLMVSSTAVYDVSDGSWVDEQTPANAGAESGAGSGTDAILREAEDLLYSRVPNAVVFRLSGIYGPGRERLITQVREGRATVPRVPRHTNRIHRDDAAGAIVHLMLREESPAPLYLGVDDDPVTSAEVLNFLAEELGLPAPVEADDTSMRGGDKLLSNRLLRSTGFSFSFPTYREGYRAILAGQGTRHA
jgi:nucleoside-diphosphate-sugar epimerase